MRLLGGFRYSLISSRGCNCCCFMIANFKPAITQICVQDKIKQVLCCLFNRIFNYVCATSMKIIISKSKGVIFRSCRWFSNRTSLRSELVCGSFYVQKLVVCYVSTVRSNPGNDKISCLNEKEFIGRCRSLNLLCAYLVPMLWNRTITLSC